MKRKQLVIGVLGALAAGYACGFPIRSIEDKDILGHPEIKLKTIFGVNEERLADTNRFPVSSDHWHEIDLPTDMGGFTTAKFSLKEEKGKLGISYVEMIKSLPPDSDDGDLLKEFRAAVDMIGKVIGVELECPGLMDVDEWRRFDDKDLDFNDVLRLCSDFRIELADGCSIDIGAKDATYVKRRGEAKLVQNAAVEVIVWRHSVHPCPRSLYMLTKKVKPGTIMREVEFGADLSQQLSEAMKDKAKGRKSRR